MHFLADGPSIPVELLEQRDRGNVVFFCGAGVSRPAGLPSFSGLAKRVMVALGTGAGSKSRILLEQSDCSIEAEPRSIPAGGITRVATCWQRGLPSPRTSLGRTG